MLLTPTGCPIDRPTARPIVRCRRVLTMPVPTLLLVLGGLAAVGCLWVWVGAGLSLPMRLLLLIWLPLLPELLLLPLATWLLPGWCFLGCSPRGCLRNQRKSACGGSPRGSAKPVGTANLIR